MPATLKNAPIVSSHIPHSTSAACLRFSGSLGRCCQLATKKPTTASGNSHPICPASCWLRSLKGPFSPFSPTPPGPPPGGPYSPLGSEDCCADWLSLADPILN